MNRVFKSVWSPSKGEWVAVSELARGKGKGSTRAVSRKIAAVMGSAVLVMAGSQAAWADINNALDLTTSANGDHVLYENDTTGANVVVNNTGSLVTHGQGSRGIEVEINSSAGGTVTINNSGSITTTDATPHQSGAGAPVPESYSAKAIYVQLYNNWTPGNVEINQTGGTLKTSSYDAAGIRVVSRHSAGRVDVNVKDTVIDVNGKNADGIFFTGQNVPGGSTVAVTIKLENSHIYTLRNPTDAGEANYGIVALQLSADASGDVTTIVDRNSSVSTGLGTDGLGTSSAAVHTWIGRDSSTGSIFVENHGQLSTLGEGSDAGAVVLNNAGTGTSNVLNTGRIVTAGDYANAIYMYSVAFAGSAAGTGDVNIANTGTVSASGAGADAVRVDSLNSSVTVRNAGLLQTKGAGASVITINQTGASVGHHVIDNQAGGVLDGLNDRAIVNTTVSGGTLSIHNAGTINGYVVLGAEDATFTNVSANSWNIRNFADTDGDGVRDAKAVAISDFGAGTDRFVNAATGAVRLAAVSGELSTSTAGEYVPVGALSSSNAGVVHGQLLNLEVFENAGLIDLGANAQAGDVFVVTGGAVAGSYGAGQYVSNGGSIKLDSFLNEGGGASLSDVVVLDDVVVGSGATGVLVVPVAGSPGGKTVGDGIKVIEVLGASPSDAFTLGAPVTFGAYEYVLAQGTGADAGNWFLQNFYAPTVQPPVTGPAGGVIWNPNIGSYLGNQYVAGMMFNQNILDRRDNVRAPDQTLWVRTNYNHASADVLGGLQEVTMKTGLVQVGADLYERDSVVAGVYAGYGYGKVDNESKQTGSTANGRVEGYHIGAYVSWLPEDEADKGPYADVWAHYAWYDNELSGRAQPWGRTKYDSTGYAVSAEVGYSFEFNKKEDGRAWIIEPHAQVIYSSIDADSFYDTNGTYYSGNQADGFQSRLGARLYGQQAAGAREGVSPFVEVNWLHNGMANRVRLNDERVSSVMGRNVGEVKVGAQGRVSDRLSLWGHAGVQMGSQDFKRYELQVGLGWEW